ncbi:MAG TPA: endonuclease/exonuclease/phosphatase family protein, partial [Acidimicrobiales bacterium]|nr:endonuclease/exonuclease/phosphatase family protein [Acidimicrobiales bacterium]
MRIVTWNVNSLKARIERVEAWITAVAPDVLCLQETKMTDEAFPHDRFTALGYQSAHHGEGRWNGVAVISRVGLDDVRPGFADGRDDPDPDAR